MKELLPQTTVKKWDILGLGCVCVDDFVYIPSYPPADTKIRVYKRDRQCGGLTATALVTAARLGARCAFAGLLGFDELSRVVEENFTREGVDVSFAPRAADAPVIHAIVIVGEDAASRNIFYSIGGRTGADETLPEESVICSSRVLFLDQYGMSGNLRAAAIAHSAGIPIVADFEEDNDPRFLELLALVDHLVLPSDLATKITGEAVPEKTVEALWNKDREAVVVTYGVNGSWFTGKDGVIRHQPAFKVKAVDTTGCGDVFHGAYAAGVAQGASLEECVRLAAATAALKATQPGGQRGIPRRNVVDDFLRASTGRASFGY